MTTRHQEADEFEVAASRIDRCLRAHRAGTIADSELVESIRSAIRTAVSDHDDPRLLVEYARCDAEAALSDPRRGDRTQLDLLDRRLALEPDHPVVEMRAALLVDEIDEMLKVDRSAGVDRLAHLCATGGTDHADIFVIAGPGLRLIRLAIDHRVPSALEAAIAPRGAGWAQLGHPRRDSGEARRVALDGLAELAAQAGEPTSGRAIDALVRLCEHLSVAMEAIARLPIHMLTVEHRDHLATSLDLVAAQPSIAQLHPEALRVPHVLRSVLWLAGDLTANRGRNTMK